MVISLIIQESIPYYLLITDVFAIAILLVIQKLNVNLVWLQIGLVVACYFAFVSSSGVTVDLRDRTLTGLYPSSFYIVHWISDICLLWLACSQGYSIGSAIILYWQHIPNQQKLDD